MTSQMKYILTLMFYHLMVYLVLYQMNYVLTITKIAHKYLYFQRMKM